MTKVKKWIELVVDSREDVEDVRRVCAMTCEEPFDFEVSGCFGSYYIAIGVEPFEALDGADIMAGFEW